MRSPADRISDGGVILNIGLPLVFFTSMAALICGYLAISRRSTRATINAIRSAAVPLPSLVMSFRASGSVGCRHMTIGGAVTSAACGICGPLG